MSPMKIQRLRQHHHSRGLDTQHSTFLCTLLSSDLICVRYICFYSHQVWLHLAALNDELVTKAQQTIGETTPSLSKQV